MPTILYWIVGSVVVLGVIDIGFSSVKVPIDVPFATVASVLVTVVGTMYIGKPGSTGMQNTFILLAVAWIVVFNLWVWMGLSNFSRQTPSR